MFARFRTPIYKNTGSIARDHLASERTFLTWLRTGLGFIALGIAVERFSRFEVSHLSSQVVTGSDSAPLGTASTLSDSASATAAATTGASRQKDPVSETSSHHEHQGLIMALLGIGSSSILYGTTRYFSNMQLLGQGLYKPSFYGAGGLSISVVGVAGMAYLSTVRERSSSDEGEG
ncbi:hypothetical protein MMC19_002582 [Ptychographa xylographoides]|nr:hypothetical protein [Ptychographa xylographoides]